MGENVGSDVVERYDPFDGGLGFSLATRESATSCTRRAWSASTRTSTFPKTRRKSSGWCSRISRACSKLWARPSRMLSKVRTSSRRLRGGVSDLRGGPQGGLRRAAPRGWHQRRREQVARPTVPCRGEARRRPSGEVARYTYLPLGAHTAAPDRACNRCASTNWMQRRNSSVEVPFGAACSRRSG